MFYNFIKRFGILTAVIVISLVSSFVSFFIVFFSYLIMQEEQPMLSIIFPIIIPLVIAPTFTFTMINLVTKVKKSENELRKTNSELEKALEEVKELNGMLPICASCKKIRDDDGYWKQVDDYISTKTDLVFSHSFCPTCEKEENHIIDTMLDSNNP